MMSWVSFSFAASGSTGCAGESYGTRPHRFGRFRQRGLPISIIVLRIAAVVTALQVADVMIALERALSL
jgi:hypothetical protein